MTLLRLLLLCCGLLLAGHSATASAARMPAQPGRIALVIGVSQYAGPARLNAPVNDARLVGTSLENLGFERPEILVDPTDAQMRASIERFVEKARDLSELGIETTAIVYFAGHGLVVDRESYLLPRNFESTGPPGPDLLRRQAINLSWVSDQLAGSGARRILLVIDACRNNPWQSGAPSFPIEPPRAPDGATQDSAIWLSAARGQAAFDQIGNEGTSPFAFSLAREIGNPNHRSLNDVFDVVITDVSTRTRGQQRPIPIGATGYNLTVTDVEWARLRQAALQQRPVFAAVDTLATSESAQRQAPLARPEFIPLFSGQPCPLPPRGFNPMSYYQRYIALHGEARLNERAQAGEICEQYLLGVGHTRPGYENREAALRLMHAVEARGLAPAVTTLTWLYTAPVMGPPDYEAARHWYQIGVNRRIPGTIRNLAASYRFGRYGTEQNIARSIEYYEMAAQLGDTLAAESLSQIYFSREAGEPNMERGTFWTRRAAELGSQQAVEALASIYFYGQGVPADKPRAMQIAQEGARAGNVHAIQWLARIHENEQGYINPARVLELSRMAAEAGDTYAMMLAGDRLIAGTGVARDVEAGLAWYRRADELGELEATLRLARYYRQAAGADNLRRGLDYANRIMAHARQGEPPDEWPVTFAYAAQLIQLIATDANAPRIDPNYLRHLARNYGRPWNIKRFTVPIRCGATPFQLGVYVFDWDRERSSVEPQFDWAEQSRGCVVPQDVRRSFNQLYDIALANNVSFADLVVYALAAAQNPQAVPPAPQPAAAPAKQQ